MTREEAIKDIQENIKPFVGGKSLDMAIEALKGGDADMTVIPEGTGLMKPCHDNVADLIARADAIEAVASADETDGTIKVFTGRQVNDILSALPSAEAKGDLISREDALEQMAQAECGLHYEDCEADNCSCSYIQRILDIPSAEGEWIDVNGDGSLWRCNKCKDTACCDGNFCPNCGAKMNGHEKRIEEYRDKKREERLAEREKNEV